MEKPYKFTEKPKFKIGQKVKCPKTLYKETEGVVTAIHKRFTDWDSDNYEISENIKQMTPACKPRRVGDTILVRKRVEVLVGGRVRESYWHESEDRVFHFDGYNVTVKSEKMNTRFSEEDLEAK